MTIERLTFPTKQALLDELQARHDALCVDVEQGHVTGVELPEMRELRKAMHWANTTESNEILVHAAGLDFEVKPPEPQQDYFVDVNDPEHGILAFLRGYEPAEGGHIGEIDHQCYPIEDDES
jgi:hypothetical protein